ncbi:MAG: hypothetical protein ABI036_13335 [Fibrobacteria bacterium]
MKKICTNSGPRLRVSGNAFSYGRAFRFFPATALAGFLLSACAFTEYGNRINQEQLDIARLETKRQSLETEYIIVLNNLEMHPSEERLIKERDEVRGKLIDVSSLIQEKRKLLDQSYREWEQKIVEEKIEKQMIDAEVKENEGKNEDVEFENK